MREMEVRAFDFADFTSRFHLCFVPYHAKFVLLYCFATISSDAVVQNVKAMVRSLQPTQHSEPAAFHCVFLALAARVVGYSRHCDHVRVIHDALPDVILFVL